MQATHTSDSRCTCQRERAALKSLTLSEASHLTGVPLARLLYLALTERIQSFEDPETNMVVFDARALLDWARVHTLRGSANP